MYDAGFVGPTPQFMNRNQTAEDPVKLPKKKVISKDDNDWLPAAEDRVSNLVMPCHYWYSDVSNILAYLIIPFLACVFL